MSKVIELTGKRFGRLIVIERSYPNRFKHPVWLCKCDCGNDKIVPGYNLRTGRTKSCGCFGKERRALATRLDYGLSCMRRTIKQYKNSAKRRGISWNLTEDQFKEITQKVCSYCGAKPNNRTKDKESFGDYIYNGIDRIDNNKGYSVNNIVPCCKSCNSTKGVASQKDFKARIKRIYNYLFKEEVNLITGDVSQEKHFPDYKGGI